MNKKQYISPELTVVSFQTERGYAQSSIGLTKFRINTLLGLNTPVVSSQEGWTTDDLFDANDGDWDVQ